MYPLAHLRSPRDSYNKIAPKNQNERMRPQRVTTCVRFYIDSTLNNYFQPLLSKYKIHRAHRSSKCCTGCKASGTARPANKSSCRAGGCRAGCMPADKWSTPVRGSAAGPKGSGTRNCRAPCPQRCGLRSGRGCCYPGRNLPARHNNASGRPRSVGAMPSRTFIASA